MARLGCFAAAVACCAHLAVANLATESAEAALENSNAGGGAHATTAHAGVAHAAHSIHKKHAAFRQGKKHGHVTPGPHSPGVVPVAPHEQVIGVPHAGAVHVGDASSPALAHGMSAHACIWTSPSGHTFDLTQFSSHEQEFHLAGLGPAAAEEFRYTFSVCKSLRSVPLPCRHSFAEGPAAAAAIQEDKWGGCQVLGSTHHVHFQQTDAANPYLGLDVVYSGGSMCGDGRPRELRIHFVCAPHHVVEVPPRFVVETPERCHYNVTWPSSHGCPLSTLSSLLLHARLGVLGTSGSHAYHVNGAAGAAALAGGSAAAAATHHHGSAGAAGHHVAPGHHAGAGAQIHPHTTGAHAGAHFTTPAGPSQHPIAGAHVISMPPPHAWSLWDLMWVSSVLWYGGLAVYCLLGCVFNVWRGRGECGWGAIPHKTYWETWLTALIPASLRDRVANLPVISHLITAGGALASAVLKVCHYLIIGVRGAWHLLARGVGNRLPPTWGRARWCLGAGSEYSTPPPETDDGRGPYKDKPKPVVKLKWEGGATDGHLVRRIAKGASDDAEDGPLEDQWYGGKVPTFAGDVKTASSDAAQRTAAAAGGGRGRGGFSSQDYDSVRLGGYNMRAEAPSDAPAASAAGGSTTVIGAGGAVAAGGRRPAQQQRADAAAAAGGSPPAQGYGQDPDSHGAVFGQAVATADLLLTGDTGINAAPGVVPGPPAVRRK